MDWSLLNFLFGILAIGIVVFCAHLWLERRRTARIDFWIKDFLASRNGELLQNLHINCTDDRLWPVLATFDLPLAGTRHLLHFTCAGPQSKFSLASERKEPLTRSAGLVHAA